MTKDRFIVIKCCFDCPHLYYDDNCHICGAAGDKELTHKVDKEVPDDCPLEVYSPGIQIGKVKKGTLKHYDNSVWE